MADVTAKRKTEGQRPSLADLHAAIMEGAVERVRPKMMTVVAIMASLLPILWSAGAGSDVMKRIALPLIGGMVSSAVLTLAVIPAIYVSYPKGNGCQPIHSSNRIRLDYAGSQRPLKMLAEMLVSARQPQANPLTLPSISRSYWS